MSNNQIKAYVFITGLYLLIVIFLGVWSIFAFYKNDIGFGLYTLILSFLLVYYINRRMKALNYTPKDGD